MRLNQIRTGLKNYIFQREKIRTYREAAETAREMKNENMYNVYDACADWAYYGGSLIPNMSWAGGLAGFVLSRGDPNWMVIPVLGEFTRNLMVSSYRSERQEMEELGFLRKNCKGSER
jgi:hypothetical protein